MSRFQPSFGAGYGFTVGADDGSKIDTSALLAVGLEVAKDVAPTVIDLAKKGAKKKGGASGRRRSAGTATERVALEQGVQERSSDAATSGEREEESPAWLWPAVTVGTLALIGGGTWYYFKDRP